MKYAFIVCALVFFVASVVIFYHVQFGDLLLPISGPSVVQQYVCVKYEAVVGEKAECSQWAWLTYPTKIPPPTEEATKESPTK